MMKRHLFTSTLQRLGLVALLGLPVARAEFQPEDVHWFYTYGGPERSEPFVLQQAGDYLYAGGLFLSTAGDNDGKNFSRFDLDTETWETVPGITDTFNGGVWDIHHADDGFIYIGGNFTRIGDLDVGGIARFDPATETWSALTDPAPTLVTPDQQIGPTNGRVFAIQKIGDLIYVGGEYTGPRNSPTDEKYIRSYNVRTQQWAKVGGGLDSDVRTLTVSPEGHLVAGGAFEGAVAQFDGNAWSLIGGGVREIGRNGIVRDVAYSRDGTLYLAGDFDEVGTAGSGNSVRDIAGYKDGVWDVMGGGFDANYVQSNGTTFNSDGVYDIAVDAFGRVYAGGDFDATAGRTNTDLRHVAMWKDGAWQALGSGVGTTGSQIINCLALGREGDLYVGGVFNEGYKNAGSAKYTFARWHPQKDFTDYIPGAANNTTSHFFPFEDKWQLTLISRPGTTYQIDVSSDMIEWVPIEGAIVDGNGNRQGFNLTRIDAPTRFYRFRAID